MKNILITGICGFIGSNLARRLVDKGHNVYGVDNLSTGFMNNLKGIKSKIIFNKYDITSKDFSKKDFGTTFDTIVHLAAVNCIPYAEKNVEEAYKTNIYGTQNVIELANRHQAKLIFASSSVVYENTLRFPTEPSEKMSPQTIYAITKALGEELVRFKCDYYTILRFFNVYGPSQNYKRDWPPIMSIFFKNLLNRKRSTIYTFGLKERDFIYIDDLIDALFSCIKKETVGLTMNVGSGKSYSLSNIYKMCSEIAKIEIDPDMDEKDLFNDPSMKTHANINVTKVILEWEPKVSIKEGLKAQYEWLKKELNK
jgi:nucleoside-diphosphate-sugar epimerase